MRWSTFVGIEVGLLFDIMPAGAPLIEEDICPPKDAEEAVIWPPSDADDVMWPEEVIWPPSDGANDGLWPDDDDVIWPLIEEAEVIEVIWPPGEVIWPRGDAIWPSGEAIWPRGEVIWPRPPPVMPIADEVTRFVREFGARIKWQSLYFVRVMVLII